MNKKPVIITVTQHKGGVGKTTSTLHLGEALMRLNKTVLFIDLDVQANLTFSVLGKGSRPKGIMTYLQSPNKVSAFDIIEESPRKTFIIPNEKELNGESFSMEKLFGNGLKAFNKIKDLLDGKIFKEFDFILIDTPPSKDTCVAAALVASDFYIVPIEAKAYCLDGIEGLFKYVSDVQSLNPKLELLGLFFPNVDLRLKDTKELRKSLMKDLGDHFIDIGIPTNSKIGNLPSGNNTIFDFDKKEVKDRSLSKGVKEWISLAREVCKRVESQSFKSQRGELAHV